MFNAGSSVRLFFFEITVLIMIGIWLSGFEQVYGFIYVVPAFLLFAAVSGLCPGLVISKKVPGVSGVKE